MGEDWLLLVPAGVEVELYPGATVDVPTLVTRTQVQAMAMAVAELKAAGIDVDLAAMIKGLGRPSVDPAQQVLPLEQAYTTAPADMRMWPCACGHTFTAAKGGEVALKRHQATCGVHASTQIPVDRRVD